MSGPPPTQPPQGARSWLRTPPPTYFRSPSPWIPQSSAAAQMRFGQSPITSSMQSPRSSSASIPSTSQYDFPTSSQQQQQQQQYHQQQQQQYHQQQQQYQQQQYPQQQQQQPFYSRPLESPFRRPSSVTMTPTSMQYQFHEPPKIMSGSITQQPDYQMQTPVYGHYQLPSIPTIQQPIPTMPTIKHPVPVTPQPQYFMVSPGPRSMMSPNAAFIIYDDAGERGPTTRDIIDNQSQDYVDEKLAEYQATIQQLQGNLFFSLIIYSFYFIAQTNFDKFTASWLKIKWRLKIDFFNFENYF